MNLFICVVSCLALLFQVATADDEVRKFPEGFKFGVATAAYQVEGAWNEDGKSESIWDYLTHTNPDVINGSTSGDFAVDSYHQYKRDVGMMQQLNLDYYRFSISWTRVLPNGFANEINQAGIDYYNNLIDELLSKNIQPMVTIYHWDLPQKLQQLGGFTNPLIVDWFVDYARVLFDNFGDRVKDWITINEPEQICLEGYGSVEKAPLLNMSGIAEYLCSKNLLLAHAKAYHLYNNEYKQKQNGMCGIAIHTAWFEPATDSVEDIQAANDARAFQWRQYAHPIFSKEGNYPIEMRTRILEKSLAQGYSKSRLPEFTEEEIDLIRGSADFIGLNAYTTAYAYRNASVENLYAVPSQSDDMGLVYFFDPEWPAAESTWLRKVPWGFYNLLSEIRDMYDNPIVYITENGWTTSGGIIDVDRISYLWDYMNVMLDAIENGCNVQRYTLWSLMDNFEWLQGYTERFGLYEVDFNDPERSMTPRKSAYFYSNVVKTKTLDPSFQNLDGF